MWRPSRDVLVSQGSNITIWRACPSGHHLFFPFGITPLRGSPKIRQSAPDPPAGTHSRSAWCRTLPRLRRPFETLFHAGSKIPENSLDPEEPRVLQSIPLRAQTDQL